MSILCICESPGKIKEMSKYLGKNVIVKASMGIFRDLNPKEMSIDFDNNFKPIYVITNADVVRNLKAAMRNIDMVYIASDKDLAGEKIAQDIYDVLKPKQYKRLIFTSITRDAIMDAIKNAGKINKNTVAAEKTRRVLDRLYGYLISPILSNHIGGRLSAGRVQSVAAELVVDKENEIKKFIEKNSDSTFFKVSGSFSGIKMTLCESTDKKPWQLEDAYSGKTARIVLLDTDSPHDKAIVFLKRCIKSSFLVHDITDKEATRSATAPFMTSTLQEEANRKFGMPVDLTMRTAQKLYEAGAITYMRTDSIEISAQGHKDIKKVIELTYGAEYYQRNHYKNKSTTAQEAHEAIRPTYPDRLTVENEINDPNQIKLYKLIWQRTIASQMKPAKINITTIQVNISQYIEFKYSPFYFFQSHIEKIIFPGFMKVYVESKDDEDKVDDNNEIANAIDNNAIDNNAISNNNFAGKIPKVGSAIIMEEIIVKQEYLRPPPRYSEASLIKKLKILEIGRPATTVNIIKTIKEREYVKIDNIPGTKKKISILSIKSKNGKPIKTIFEDSTSILIGKEMKKLIPTELGKNVNDFLVEHFAEMMDYNFTAKIEKELDAVENGDKIWHNVVKKFHDKLNPIVIELSKTCSIQTKDSGTSLGTDKKGSEIFSIKTKYGPAVRKKVGDKFVYSKIVEPLTLETIKLADAIKLLAYPKVLGKYKSIEVKLHKGKYGFYLSYNGSNYSFSNNISNNDVDDDDDDVDDVDDNKVNNNNNNNNRDTDYSKISLEDAIDVINNKKTNTIAEFDIKNGKKTTKATVLNGQYGAYISVLRGKKKVNYPVPRHMDPKKLTEKIVQNLISQKKDVGSRRVEASGSKTSTSTTTKQKTVRQPKVVAKKKTVINK